MTAPREGTIRRWMRESGAAVAVVGGAYQGLL